MNHAQYSHTRINCSTNYLIRLPPLKVAGFCPIGPLPLLRSPHVPGA